MKHIKLLFLVATAGAVLMACGDGTKKNETTKSENSTKEGMSKTININTEHSVVNWLGSLVGVYDHYGLLKFKNGNIVLENGVVKSGSFVVDMATMQATDDNYDVEKGSTKEKLIGHLSSPDFFAVEEFPEASFVIKNHSGDVIKGQLTIRGKTNDEEVTDVKIEEFEGKLVFYGQMVFNRQKYDVAWQHPIKDKVLKDNIELKIKILE